MRKYIAPLIGLAVVACTLAAFYSPECLEREKSIVVPGPAPKSLVVWWEYAERSAETDGGWKPEGKARHIAWYAGSVVPGNLIARRAVPGRLEYGPKALDTPYSIRWRAAIDGKVHYNVDAPEGARLEQLRAELATFETQPIGDVMLNPRSNNSPTAEPSETPQ